MVRCIVGGLAPRWVAFLTLSVGALSMGPAAAESAASSALAAESITVSVSNQQSVVEQQVQQARTRLAGNLAMPHPGTPQGVVRPWLDGSGSGLAARLGTGPAVTTTRAQAVAASGSRLLGLDVSGYQGNVDWANVVANGARFAYVKATQATSYQNPYFAQQYNGSYHVGLIRGAYHFALPGNSNGAAQADYFVGNGGGWSGDGRTLPGMLDIEYNPYGAACYGLTVPQMVNWIASFDDEYHFLTHRWPDIYSTTDWWTRCTANSAAFGRETLSVANWSASPYPLPHSWTTYTIWQFANSGALPGDQELFDGDLRALVAFATGRPADRILNGQTLVPGQSISSADGYRVVMQTDGNLVEYDQHALARWNAGTSRHPGAYAVMQGDGNLVVYLGGRPLWSSGTGRQGPSFAVIQGDGNFVIYTDSGRGTWSSRGGRIR